MFQVDKQIQVTTVAHPCLPKWSARIDAAEKRGEFDFTDEVLALNWDRCAFGEAHSRYPMIAKRDSMNWPADPALYELGHQFTAAALTHKTDFAKARTILAAIEARLSEILR